MTASAEKLGDLDAPVSGEDVALVRAAMHGDLAAREQLFRRHFPTAVNLAFRLVPSEDPEDLAQDGLLEALKSLHQLVAPEAFAAWLRRIIVSKVTQRIRRKQLIRRLGFAKPEHIDADLMVGAGAPPDVRLELKEVYAQVQRLPADERVALVLRRVEGLSLDEVAQALGVSLATAKRRLAAAEANLKTEVGDA